jgi:hypothetical protein
MGNTLGNRIASCTSIGLELFQPIREALLDDGDFYFHLIDFATYMERSFNRPW